MQRSWNFQTIHFQRLYARKFWSIWCILKWRLQKYDVYLNQVGDLSVLPRTMPLFGGFGGFLLRITIMSRFIMSLRRRSLERYFLPGTYGYWNWNSNSR